MLQVGDELWAKIIQLDPGVLSVRQAVNGAQVADMYLADWSDDPEPPTAGVREPRRQPPDTDPTGMLIDEDPF
jgi:hypothetical protein